MGTELTRTTSTKKKRPIVGLDLDDREVHGHGQQLLARAGQPYLKMSYSTFGYGGAYASSGAQVGLSSSPISHYTVTALSLLCPLSTLESPLGRLLRLGPRTVCKPGVFGRNGPRCGIKRDTGVFVTTCAPDFTRARHFFRLSARSDLSPLPTHIPQALHTVQGAQ